MRRDLELSSTRIQGSSALRHRTRVSSLQQRPVASSSLAFRLGSTHSVNTWLRMLLFLLRIAALTADAILRLALVLSSLPLFHYGLCCGVPTTLYIQRLSL